jgi:manganese/zinc/iron transport system ATP- binding protein
MDHPAPRSREGLAVTGLSVAYGTHLVLEDVTVHCPRGELLGLLGPNGSGKSTLLKAALNLVPRLAGEVTLDGRPLDRSMRVKVAYTPQRNDVDWSFPITVEEVVLLGRQGRLGLFGRPGAEDRRIALAALERLGMSEHRREQISELSGGQQQRVFLARSIAQGGDVMLLDEPLTGVDETTQEVILDLLSDLRVSGQVLVMSTHDLAQAAEVCDRLCLLNGRVVAFGLPQEVLTSEALVRAWGGVSAEHLAAHFGDVHHEPADLGGRRG